MTTKHSKFTLIMTEKQANGIINGSMVIVPVEPTDEMLKLGAKFYRYHQPHTAKDFVMQIYKAMINKEGQDNGL